MILAQIALSKREFLEAKKYSSKAIERAGTLYPDVAIGAKITFGTTMALSGATAEGLRICGEAFEMAKKTGEEAMISDAMLAFAEALYEDGKIDESLKYALNVQERLARSGQHESEWRAWLLAARCSIQAGNRELGQVRLTQARNTFSNLQQQWGADTFDRYQKRSDIQFLQKQLSPAISAVP